MPATRPLESPAPDILSRVWPVRCWFRAVRLQLAGLWGTRVAAMGFGWLIRVDREQRYNQLQDIIAILGLDELSEDDRTRIYLFGGQIRAWKPPGSRRNVPAKQIWGAAKPRMRETAEIPCISTLGGRLTYFVASWDRC